MEVKILDFTGKWCSTCVILDKVMKSEIIPKYRNKVKFVKIDVEENEDLTKRYDILFLPTLILLKKGKEIWRKSGSIDKSEIIKEIGEVVK